MTSRKSSLRLWPAIVILVAGLAGQAWAWLRDEPTRQMRVMDSLFYGVVTLFLLLLWLFFFSRLAGRLRLRIFGALFALGALFFTLVEIRGVSGDLVPRLGWRWASQLAPAPEGSGSYSAVPGEEGGFPQFLGPQRDARLRDVRLRRDWPAAPPREVWRRPVGAGWSSFAVIGNLAITQEQRGEQEAVVAYDLSSGEPVCSHSDEARYATTVGGVGPRATPTIASGRVFTVGSTGILNALDLASGRELWSVDLVAEHGAEIPDWGKSSSPLVDGPRVIVPVRAGGRSLIAFAAESGEVLWQEGSGGVSYSSPRLASLDGREQVLIFNSDGVAGHDPETGTVLWTYPWSRDQPNVAQPVVLGADRVLISSGYGIGSSLLRVSETESSGLVAQEVWTSRRLKLKFAQAVEFEGSLYGLDDGVLTSIDPATGERRWKRGRYGHGQILLVGDLLLVQTEAGRLILVEPDPSELKELASIEALSGHAWNTMAFSPPYLLLRNHQEAVCYELALAEERSQETS